LKFAYRSWAQDAATALARRMKILIAGFSAIETEAELVQIRLKLCATTVICAEQKRFQVADGFVQPMQVARFILFLVQRNARQVPIASVAVAFDF